MFVSAKFCNDRRIISTFRAGSYSRYICMSWVSCCDEAGDGDWMKSLTPRLSSSPDNKNNMGLIPKTNKDLNMPLHPNPACKHDKVKEELMSLVQSAGTVAAREVVQVMKHGELSNIWSGVSLRQRQGLMTSQSPSLKVPQNQNVLWSRH